MQRNPYFDNVRVVLIFLVVFGHIIQPFISESDVIRSLYVWIYIFHMPAFILISGYFAKGSSDKKYVWNLFKKLLIPYFIFQIVYTGYYFMLGSDGWQSGLFNPQWSLWFLMSLFCWHIMLIFFKRIRPIYSIAFALLIGVVIGHFSEIGHAFSLSRTFVFFPFFLVGYFVTEKIIMQMKRKVVMATGLVVMLAFAIAIYYLPDFNTGWLFASRSYSELDVSTGGGIYRFILYASSFAMLISVLAWIPKKQIKGFTRIGAHTLYIYLLHGFFIQFFRHIDLFQVNHIMDLIGLAALSIALVYILSREPVRGVTQPLVEGEATWYKGKWTNRKTQIES